MLCQHSHQCSLFLFVPRASGRRHMSIPVLAAHSLPLDELFFFLSLYLFIFLSFFSFFFLGTGGRSLPVLGALARLLIGPGTRLGLEETRMKDCGRASAGGGGRRAKLCVREWRRLAHARASTHTHTFSRTRAHTHERTHTHTRTHAHTHRAWQRKRPWELRCKKRKHAGAGT